jgi:hypothetical protein
MSASRQNSRNSKKKLSRQVAIAAMIAGGVIHPSLSPAFAAGTLAGTDIVNKATATYTDPSGQPLNSTSNEVTITVAEVAGLTNVAVSKLDVNGGAVEANDVLFFDFAITNTGNKTTTVYIPGTENNSGRKIAITELGRTNLTMSATPDSATDGMTNTALNTGVANGSIDNNILYSTDGGSTWNLVPDTGLIPNVAPDAVIQVRVIGKVPAGLATGDNIQVRLGNTGNIVQGTYFDPITTPSGTQNQPDIVSGGDTGGEANDVRSTGGSPANGQREAAAASGVFEYLNNTKPLALATVRKTHDQTIIGDPTDGTDDLIPYNLSLEVKTTDPSGQFDPAALEGTDIKLDSGSGAQDVQRILISDRIPTGATLNAVNSVPTNWTAVYTTDTSDAVAASGRTETTWKVLVSGDYNNVSLLSTATRIGFIYNNGTLNPSASEIQGFKFTVKSTGTGTIANVAQVFGQTAGDLNNEIVFDESGDNDPNNFEGVNPPDSTGSNYVPTSDASGLIDSTNNQDTGNNNQGSGPKGEANVVVISITSAQILVGPDGVPTAQGTTGVNDDFTNKSIAVPSGTDTSAPGIATLTGSQSVIFKNTVNNPSTTAPLSNVTLEPLAPSEAQTVSGINYGVDSSIPDGTEVTIFYDPNPGISGDEKTATYSYQVTSGTGAWTLQGGSIPVNVGTINASSSVTYTVTVTLPGGRPVLTGYSVPFVAFADNNVVAGVGDGFTNENVNNITINRAWTGYMQLRKEARILRGSNLVNATTGVEATSFGANDGWSSTFGTNVLRPSDFIEYRMTYKNLSEVAAGSGNQILTGNNFTITDESPAVNGWATVTTHQKNTEAKYDTASGGANSDTTVKYFDGSTQLGTTDPNNGTSVTKYVNEVGPVAPQIEGRFQFRRQVN